MTGRRPISRRAVHRRTLLAGAGALALAAPTVRAQVQTGVAKGSGDGVALVIGNSKYQWEAPLPNVRRDAPDIARRFGELGLKVNLVQDAGRDAMRQAVERFLAGLKGADFAAFYFAGHGVSWNKTGYLVPSDADLSSPGAVERLVSVPAIYDGIGGAAHGLLVFDNCRNNPADGWRQRETLDQAAGSSEQAWGRRPPPNTLMLFSTAPGRVALDGRVGENSPFAAAFLRQFEGASVDFQGLPARLRRDLLIATQGRQVLWDRNTYTRPFVLAGKPSATPRSGGGPGGNWAADPSKIVELTSTYAYAQASGLPLPPGLIAHRPPGGSRDGIKVGGFRYVSPARESALFVVMSVEEQQTAELIMSSKLGGRGGWRFLQGTLSGDSIDMLPKDGGRRHAMRWSDANSGSMTIFPLQNSPSSQDSLWSTTFTRID
jgi:hypothetical protein